MLLSFKCSSSLLSLNKGSFLSVEKHAEDVIVSQNQMFCAGFSQVRENAFSFDIWFNESHTHNNSNTVVWIANREQPVNGKLSKISLLNSGKVVLVNAGQIITWSSNTAPHAPVELHLQDDGNLVLRELQGKICGKFRFHNRYSSSRQTNLSSGFYKLLFDDDNVLRPVYDGSDVSSTYWPHPWLRSWEAGRFNYNSSRVAVLDSLGNFNSSDSYAFSTDDHGRVMPRRLTLDSDGNVRVYSRNEALKKWYVSWHFIFDTCTILGICGANSSSNYDPQKQRRCSCLPGYRVKNHSDWSYGDDGDEGYSCYTKILLLNGRRSQRFKGTIYLRLPKNKNFSREESVSADDHVCSVKLPRDNVRKPANPLELICFFMIWSFLIWNRQKSGADQQGLHLAEVGIRKFSHFELKEAIKGFSQEIGGGAGGVVYKDILSDQRHAAIERLYDTKQGEGEFLAEVSIIGRLNLMNLIEMWGYCAEGKHRLLPKVADFGLSKLLNKNNLNNNSSFSMIRGTRGYMAPEWIYTLPITSKVDVSSFGIVLLEMITGKSPTMDIETVDGTEPHDGRLVTWVREKKRRTSWIEQILDPSIEPSCDVNKMEILATVAFDCVEEDKDVRPTMKQVIEMLQSYESDA
ncbi:hypothetical protein GYH30_050238 [Glycine max]|uniref:Protein kinase domain-containing protein n=2 Tax=Glycine subgen. Soja TaxID=1462606 RepID=K7MSV9_SOYBN|nr:hypothetical protein GYH30_050238 [Glycine max]